MSIKYEVFKCSFRNEAPQGYQCIYLDVNKILFGRQFILFTTRLLDMFNASTHLNEI